MSPSDMQQDGDIKAIWRQYQQAQAAQAPDIDIAISASFTVEPVVPYLGATLLGKGFTAPKIEAAPFNQIQRLCLDLKGVMGRDDFSTLIVMWRLEDLFPELLARSLDDASALPLLLQEISSLAGAVAQLRKKFKGTLIMSTPPYPVMPGYDVRDIGQATAGMSVHQSALRHWTQEMLKIERVRLFDLNALVMHTGIKNAHDMRKWYLYRQPYAEKFWEEVGRHLGRIVSMEKFSPRKCIVLDLDNTLWGGIIGEDGLGGIALGDEFPGKAFRDFQRQLMHLKSKGIMLAVASKNNPEDAYEVFDRHDAMVLGRKDIAAFEIHWESKVESIKRVAQKLNIGLDALVFVDDNLKEIGEVRERLPQVMCLTVPEETAYLPAIFDNTGLFDIAEVTDEDRKRTDMIVADSARQQASDSMSEEEFRAAMELKIDVFEAEKQHLARITQLINKTNQFNLTTRRRTQDEVEQLSTDTANTKIVGMDIRDKYGEYGLVGAAVLQKSGTTCIIDTLLMSCRVLGRGAETTFIAKIAEAAKALGCDKLSGKYIPTAKNAMVAELYKNHNFTHDAASDNWNVALGDVPPPPGYLAASLSLRKGS